MRTTFSLAAGLGLAVVASACNDDAAALTRDEWVNQATAICAHAEVRAGTAFETFDEPTAIRDELVRIVREQVDRLDALAAPAELRPDVDALAEATRAAVDEAAALDVGQLDAADDDLFAEADRLAASLGVTECGVAEDEVPDQDEPVEPAEPSVAVVGVADGDVVASPVALTMVARGVAVEPAGEVRDGAGHLHLMIDVPCVEPGRPVPADDAHRHFGRGQTGVTLDLPAGRHTLCVQMADGAHTALDLTDEVTFEVAG
jgi:hypothetical protein